MIWFLVFCFFSFISLKSFTLLSRDKLLCCPQETEAPVSFASCDFATAHYFPKWQHEHHYETRNTDSTSIQRVPQWYLKSNPSCLVRDELLCFGSLSDGMMEG